MALNDRKIQDWTQPVTSLADKPQMSAAELKAAFDGNTNQVRPALNGLIDDLQAAAAAGELGFAPTPGVQAETVQEAIESVQKQLVDIALGTVPDGSIDHGKLSGEVNAEFDTLNVELDTLREDLQEETIQRAQADTDLQSQIHTKAEIVIGIYGGNNADSRLISLGFKPKAVLVTDRRCAMLEANVTYFGGFSTTAHSSPAITIGEDGFTVYNRSVSKWYTNHVDFSPYNYIAFK